ncbi:hypothetical protein Q5752_001171 [Cryptotrichosporon argae]
MSADTPAQDELTVPAHAPRPVLIVVMGPASCGKSTVGSELASALQIPFIDGDSLHPKSNIDKMSAGHPLTDADRLPWLALIRSTAERVCKEQYEAGGIVGADRGGVGRPAVVIACSALKKWYRDILRGEVEARPPTPSDLPSEHPHVDASKLSHHAATPSLQTLFVYCNGSRDLLLSRIAGRAGHFFHGSAMLDSQLAALEDPTGEGGVVDVDIGKSKEDVGRDAEAGVRRLFKQLEDEGK